MHAQLAVAAAHDDGRALGKAGVGGSLRAHVAGDLAALLDRAKDIGAQAAALGDRGVPGAGLEVHDAGGGAVGGLDGHLAGELIDEPVVKHANAGGLLVDLGHLVLDPEEAGSARGVGLAALAVDLPSSSGFMAMSCPTSSSRAHRRWRRPRFPYHPCRRAGCPRACRWWKRRRCLGGHAGLGEDVAHAAAGEIPVVHPVKIHAAGRARVLGASIPAGPAKLLALEGEDDGAHAAGSGVHGQEVLFHAVHLLVLDF